MGHAFGTAEVLDSLRHVIQCPACGGALEGDGPLVCTDCGAQYGFTDTGNLDLRLGEPKQVHVDLVVGEMRQAPYEFSVGQRARPVGAVIPPEVVPASFGPLLDSYVPPAPTPDAIAVDIGCGPELGRRMLEAAGWNYVGLDIEHPDCPLFGDVHAMPFRDDSIGLVLAAATVEEWAYRLVGLKEVRRVLTPGGHFIGTTGFLLPDCGDQHRSTVRGLANLFGDAGLTAPKIMAAPGYTGYDAISEIAGFPRAFRLGKAVAWLPKSASRAWWGVGRLLDQRSSSETWHRRIGGAWTFVSRAPES